MAPPRALLGASAAVLGLGLLPVLGLPAFYEAFLYLVFHWVALATSWNLLSGYTGYFSFGHGAFFGAGMYTTATLTAAHGVPFLWTLPAAGGVAAALGLGLGAVAFRVRRVRGELFALLTLAVTFILATIVLNTSVDGGPGVYLSAVPIPRWGGGPTTTLYLLALAVAAVAVLLAWAVPRSRLGLGLFAIHDDEDAAEVLGVPTYRAKLTAFALSCGLAGVTGGIHAVFVTYVTVAETFSITVPLYVVLMSILGGARHPLGPAAGATVVTVLTYAFTAGERAVAGRALVGVILVGTILFLPDGLLGRLARRGERRRAARAREAAELTAAVAEPTASASTNAGGAHAGCAPLLVCRGVVKAFAGVRALDGVDLEVQEGEILGLVGPNGSGKSTLINVISGHFPADAGSIRFEGRELAGLRAHRIARAGIARTYQIPRPFARLPVLDNAAVGAQFGGGARDRRAADREARRQLESAGLGAKAAELPGALTLHERKFLELARALAARPRLLLLDEVLSGLTAGEMDEALARVREIRGRGTTIVFVEHVMRAVTALSDRVVVLAEGRVLAAGAPADVLQEPRVVTAYLGTAYLGTGGPPRG